jgi:hypothetical protein
MINFVSTHLVSCDAYGIGGSPRDKPCTCKQDTMTFDQWFKWYCEKNMSCINHRRDFRACWNASKQESKFVSIETNVLKPCTCPETKVDPLCPRCGVNAYSGS